MSNADCRLSYFEKNALRMSIKTVCYTIVSIQLTSKRMKNGKKYATENFALNFDFQFPLRIHML